MGLNTPGSHSETGVVRLLVQRDSCARGGRGGSLVTVCLEGERTCNVIPPLPRHRPAHLLHTFKQIEEPGREPPPRGPSQSLPGTLGKDVAAWVSPKAAQESIVTPDPAIGHAPGT